MNTECYMKTLIYVISMEFLSPGHRDSSLRNVPGGEEQGETAVFTAVLKCRLAYLQ